MTALGPLSRARAPPRLAHPAPRTPHDAPPPPQGQYSFAIFDSERRQVFAARDSTGLEPLFYQEDEDGNIGLTNDPASVPEDADAPAGAHAESWHEVPPGHYLSGKHPRIHQFALTPEQLYMREYLESIEDDLSQAGGSDSGGLSPTAASLASMPSNMRELLSRTGTATTAAAQEAALFAFDY